jgi:ATP-dependent Clp protease ATP-binding subunit ClpA
MAELDYHLSIIYQVLASDLLLTKLMFFPEVTCFGSSRKRLRSTLEGHAGRLLKLIDPLTRCRRLSSETPTVGSREVQLGPPPRSAAWRVPVHVTFPLVRWSHGMDSAIAYLPTLGIEVLAPTREVLDKMLDRHILAALSRSRASGSLARLFRLQHCQKLEVEAITLPLSLPSPKQIAQEESDRRQKPPSVLEEVGVDLTNTPLSEAYEIDEVVTRLAETLTGRRPRSVLLIGPSGVGKTAAVRQLVRERVLHGLGQTPFWATSGARLVAGMTGFGQWEERCQNLWREASHLRAILHLGNLEELLEVGMSEFRDQSIASFLRPYIARGDLLCISECTPEQLGIIERKDPAMLAAFSQLRVEGPSPERARAILRAVAREAEVSGPPHLPADALDALDRLHRRYATYSAYPGRPLRFLTNLLRDLEESATQQGPPDKVELDQLNEEVEELVKADDMQLPADVLVGLVRPQRRPRRGTFPPVTVANVTRHFARETGLPLFLLEDSLPLDLERARSWFGQRVIGQPEAVDLVVDLLALIKAGLGRPRKPLASLLFIGPTGVGKTEMAKSLAEYLFGSPDRLTRLDMSEFADPLAVGRLIGGLGRSEGLLTARVREQPFSVVLLDEFEKAHPLLFDLLLQVLGEGRLTDASGRLADFCNAVVILTSNLGAESFQQGAFGFPGTEQAGNAARVERERAREHFQREVQRFVRPELYNRFDRIVAFAPLDETTILQIAQRQMDLLQKRDGIRYRGVQLMLGEGVVRQLAASGYDIRYGARPLKRAIERELLAPLAERMNGYTAETPLRVEVKQEQQLAVIVRARVDERGRQLTAGGVDASAAEVVTRCLNQRRLLQKLHRSNAWLELVNEIYRLERTQRSRRPDQWNQSDQLRAERLRRSQAVSGAFEKLWQDVCVWEEESLLGLYGRQPLDVMEVGEQLRSAERSWLDSLLALYALNFEKADRILLAVYSEHGEQMLDLARGYYDLFGQDCQKAEQAPIEVWQFLPPAGDRKEDPTPERRLVLNPDALFAGAASIRIVSWDRKTKSLDTQERIVDAMMGCLGILLAVNAPHAVLRYAAEKGLHVLKGEGKSWNCFVDTSDAAAREYNPPPGIDRRGTFDSEPKRRIWWLDQAEMEDLRLGQKFRGSDRNALLRQAIEQLLQRILLAQVET